MGDNCLPYDPVPISEDQEARLPGVNPVSFPPASVGQLSQPIVCIPPRKSLNLDLTFTITNQDGAALPGIVMTIGSQTGVTNSSGVVGPFIFETDGAPVLLTLVISDLQGVALANATVGLAFVSKKTNAKGAVTFNIAGNGAVS